jgi:DNA adenine methylase
LSIRLYVHSTRDTSAKYRCELTDDQHIELLTLLKGVQGKVMIAGYASALYDDLLTGWQRLTRQHYAAASGAKMRTEVLWISQNKMAEKSAITPLSEQDRGKKK